jgi:iron(III) transport system ATP-binding protein/putative spermidine/putrescine transport system ATP-binding protein/spermidine/putrescine transport system ATP-binding protein
MDLKPDEPPMLILKDIHKFYGKNEVIKGVSLEVRKGELVTFVGPSGCGKTTLLRLIGGFTDVSSGDIILDGQRINDLPPNLRDTRICFQNYALFPHMTVAENIGYGLKINKWPRNRIEARVRDLLKMVELDAFGDRMIDKLSGGQQQRVAFARALSLEPKVLLLDEPLSNLDANLRLVMREEIRNLQERLRITTVFVTHDQFEAMAISDRLVVMRDGLIEQVGSPIEIYERPANEFIAGFVGYVNFMAGRIASIDVKTRDTIIDTEYGKIEITLEQDDIARGDEVLMVIRPESVNIALDRGGKGKNVLSGALKFYMYAGSLAKCTVMIGDRTMVIDQYNPRDAQQFKHAAKVEVEIPRSVHLLKKKS